MALPKNQAGGNRTILRPDPSDILYSELNLERWPGLWTTRDSNQPRELKRSLTYPDGSTLDVVMTVSAPPGTGTLTTETQKFYTALLKMRQDAWGANAERAPKDRRMFFSLRGTAKLLAAGREKTSKTSIWGSTKLASIKRHVRKLSHNHIDFRGDFWDAASLRRRNLEGGFTIVSDFLIAEERRFRKGTAIQLPLEIGYIRLSPWIEDNLDKHYTAPVYFSERMAIQSPFAQQLYGHLNLAMAGQGRYHRRFQALFEEDFPEMGKKYPAPSQRKRTLERAFKHLIDRKITTGILTSLKVEKTADGSDYKLVVVKGRFPKSALPTGEETSKPYIPSVLGLETQARRDCLVDDILELTHDPQSQRFYEIVAAHVPEPVIRRFLSEIKGERLEGGPMRSSGAIFTTKVKAWASENGKADFWKKSA